MSSYEVAGHVVDHPPLFACRKHKAILGLNRSFVEELLAWAPDLQPQNLTDVGAACLDGDDQAFKTSEYLIPPKVLVFNPRKIQGAGALPVVIVLVDRRFYGLPSSYLRRRIFDGCEECTKENDPASDSSFQDYRPPAKRAGPPSGAVPAQKARPTQALTREGPPTTTTTAGGAKSGTIPAQPPAAPKKTQAIQKPGQQGPPKRPTIE
jgi:hypothetical protein